MRQGCSFLLDNKYQEKVIKAAKNEIKNEKERKKKVENKGEVDGK